ncbi:hypothetical protein NPIL_49951 [Nephila pilipes]|uniref:Uncharacterized protein n=1 Tax=Nephila pilipes TaxID=299642 RepID=A0A8X6TIB9_NEPPI|nr:hypothetical protein NPIL_49951 [Nephila pilipes]
MANLITAEHMGKCGDYPIFGVIDFLRSYKEKLSEILEEEEASQNCLTSELMTILGIPAPPTDFLKIQKVLRDESDTSRRCVGIFFLELFLKIYSGTWNLSKYRRYDYRSSNSKNTRRVSLFKEMRTAFRTLLHTGSEIMSEVVAISFLKDYLENVKNISKVTSVAYNFIACDIMRKLGASSTVDFSEIQETLSRMPLTRIYVESYCLGIILNLFNTNIYPYVESRDPIKKLWAASRQKENENISRVPIKISRNVKLTGNEMCLNDAGYENNNDKKSQEGGENALKAWLKKEMLRKESQNIQHISKNFDDFNTYFKKFITYFMCTMLLISVFLNCFFLLSNTAEQKSSFTKKENLLLDNAIDLWHIDTAENDEWTINAKAYAASHMFGTTWMQEKISASLQSGLTVSNVWIALYLADINEDLHLKKAVQEFLLRNAEATLLNDTWRDELFNSVQKINDRIGIALKSQHE